MDLHRLKIRSLLPNRSSLVYFSAGLVTSALLVYSGPRLVHWVIHLVSNEKKTLVREASNHLPRLRPSEDIIFIEGLPGQVSFDLGSAWKINTKAPTWFALFEKAQESHRFVEVREWAYDDFVGNSLEIPVLNSESLYDLQGTLYTCKTGDESLCTLNSFRYFINVRKNDAVNSKIKLNQIKIKI